MERNKKRVVFSNSEEFQVSSFGEENENIFFYVIRQESTGRGLFSLVSSVLCHLDIADRNSFIPVVDFENFTTVYNDGEIFGTKNVWEYYFKPVSSYRLDEVYRSKNVIFSTNKYPAGYDYSITKVPGLYSIYKKYIKYNECVLKTTDRFKGIFDSNVNVLGIHYRGQEMRTARGHWFPPTFQQIKHAVQVLNREDYYKKIFVVTEDATLLDSLIKEYGDKVFYTDSYRTRGENAYKKYPRDNHFFQLGLEILVDTMLLSQTNAIIKCSSNVAEFATFINNNRFASIATVDNGPNTRLWPFNYFIWPIRNILPPECFGFSLKNVIFS